MKSWLIALALCMSTTVAYAQEQQVAGKPTIATATFQGNLNGAAELKAGDQGIYIALPGKTGQNPGKNQNYSFYLRFKEDAKQIGETHEQSLRDAMSWAKFSHELSGHYNLWQQQNPNANIAEFMPAIQVTGCLHRMPANAIPENNQVRAAGETWCLMVSSFRFLSNEELSRAKSASDQVYGLLPQEPQQLPAATEPKEPQKQSRTIRRPGIFRRLQG